MSASTIVVALNAQLLRRLDLRPREISQEDLAHTDDRERKSV
jgi:hypothetical protein